jgi:glycerol-3-phosphate O-acyltransferase / dihydroxyacetone phosphate acyltransferase
LLILAQAIENGFKDREFKIIPKVDQAALYHEVTKSLVEGTCICLFPEGGSHDRPDLLPLKAGVAIMALAAMASMRDRKDKGGERVSIVPCGMNYFHGHRFRSHVLVEFGKPVEVTDEMMELYSRDKRAACADLLQVVEKRLKAVCHLPPLTPLSLISLHSLPHLTPSSHSTLSLISLPPLTPLHSPSSHSTCEFV